MSSDLAVKLIAAAALSTARDARRRRRGAGDFRRHGRVEELMTVPQLLKHALSVPVIGAPMFLVSFPPLV